MSDAFDYFQAHAVEAVRKARRMPFGRMKQKQRTVARIYHLLAREAAYASNVHHLEDFRTARQFERQIGREGDRTAATGNGASPTTPSSPADRARKRPPRP